MTRLFAFIPGSAPFPPLAKGGSGWGDEKSVLIALEGRFKAVFLLRTIGFCRRASDPFPPLRRGGQGG